jgi:two-component system, chemotaxis family, response regulator Rcp1
MACTPVSILLVEDNAADVFFVREALRSEGIESELFVAQDGEKAVQFIESAELSRDAPCPQVILLDLNLPRKSGAEVLLRITQSSRLASVPVVIVTSSDAPSDRAETAKLGARGYFVKPRDLDEFLKLGLLIKDVLREQTMAPG